MCDLTCTGGSWEWRLTPERSGPAWSPCLRGDGEHNHPRGLDSGSRSCHSGSGSPPGPSPEPSRPLSTAPPRGLRSKPAASVPAVVHPLSPPLRRRLKCWGWVQAPPGFGDPGCWKIMQHPKGLRGQRRRLTFAPQPPIKKMTPGKSPGRPRPLPTDTPQKTPSRPVCFVKSCAFGKRPVRPENRARASPPLSCESAGPELVSNPAGREPGILHQDPVSREFTGTKSRASNRSNLGVGVA